MPKKSLDETLLATREELSLTENKLRETKERLSLVEIDSYLQRVKENYLSSNERKRNHILKQLGIFIRKFAFDPLRAKQIREEAELTQSELAEELGLTRDAGQGKIATYEGGYHRPGNPPWGGTKKYMLWLKDQGYNPFDL